MNILKTMLATTTALALQSAGALAADCPIKVGVLHSLSGTMAISETTLKDTMLMLIDEQERQRRRAGLRTGGGRCRSGRDWPLFAEKARELLTVHEVDVIFGNWTSVSRKSVLPVIEELNGLLFYPVQYEGEESSKNVFYTGAAPNQQAIPATDYFPGRTGRREIRAAGHRLCLPAHHEQHPGGLSASQRHRREDIFVTTRRSAILTGPRSSPTWWRWGPMARKVGVISTINGDANIGFYKELAAADIC